MSQIKLVRNALIKGVEQNIVLTGEILEDNDQFIKIKLSEDVKSNLKKHDWKKDDEVWR